MYKDESDSDSKITESLESSFDEDSKDPTSEDHEMSGNEGEGEGEEGDDSREWDDKCYICTKGGKVMVCETCTHVAHPRCIGLKSVPDDDWFCENCLVE